MTSTESGSFLLLNYMKTEASRIGDVSRIVAQPRATDARFGRRIYQHLAGDRLLELIDLPALGAFGEVFADEGWQSAEGFVRPHLVADFRRQILQRRSVVKQAAAPSAAAKPHPLHLHLGRMEIAPRSLGAYRVWEQEHLWPQLRARSTVETVCAYHSAVSTEPGALFLAWFSSSPQQYKAELEDAQHQALMKHAGDQFVLGGAAAIATSLWTPI